MDQPRPANDLSERHKAVGGFGAGASAGGQKSEVAGWDVQYVRRFLREHQIDLAAHKSWCESNDPASRRKTWLGSISTPAKVTDLCADCDRCFKETMFNETHMSDRQRGIVLCVLISRMRHDGGRVGRVGVLTSIDGASSRAVLRVVLRTG